MLPLEGPAPGYCEAFRRYVADEKRAKYSSRFMTILVKNIRYKYVVGYKGYVKKCGRKNKEK
jgi:hypothetical protein